MLDFSFRTIAGAVAALLLSAGVAHAQETTIRFTLGWKTQGSDAAFFVARDKGYYKAEGLNVVIDQGEGSGATVTRIMAPTRAERCAARRSTTARSSWCAPPSAGLTRCWRYSAGPGVRALPVNKATSALVTNTTHALGHLPPKDHALLILPSRRAGACRLQ